MPHPLGCGGTTAHGELFGKLGIYLSNHEQSKGAYLLCPSKWGRKPDFGTGSGTIPMALVALPYPGLYSRQLFVHSYQGLGPFLAAAFALQ